MMKKWVAALAVACMLLASLLAAGCEASLPGTSMPSVGQSVYFGHWAQTAGGAVKPILWTVMRNDGSTLELISAKILDYQQYDPSGNGYDSSALRTWLTGTFYSGAFTNREKTALTGSDKVTLAQGAEAMSAMFGGGLTATATDYAKGEGCTDDTYWLAADVGGTDNVQVVDASGTQNFTGIAKTSLAGVRPVINVDLSAVAAVTQPDLGTQLAGSDDGELIPANEVSDDPVTLFVHDGSLPTLTVTGCTLDMTGLTIDCSASAALTGNQKVLCLLASGDDGPAYVGWSSLAGSQLHFTGMFPPTLDRVYTAYLCVGTIEGDDVTNYAGMVAKIEGIDALNITGIEEGDKLDIGLPVSFTAIGLGVDNAHPQTGDVRLIPVSWSVVKGKGGSTVASGTWSKAPYSALYTPGDDGVYTLSVVFRADQYENGAWEKIEGYSSTPRTVHFTVGTNVHLALSPASGKIYKGGRITITPSEEGGTWEYDSDYLSRDGNDFTGLKVGTTRVTFRTEMGSVHTDITILNSSLPATGQDFSPALLLTGLAALMGLAATAVFIMRKRKNSTA